MFWEVHRLKLQPESTADRRVRLNTVSSLLAPWHWKPRSVASRSTDAKMMSLWHRRSASRDGCTINSAHGFWNSRVQARSRGGRWAGLSRRSTTFICGSRRDQEEGGGAGPSREPRRDQEQGGGAGLRKLDFFCFSCFSTAVLQTLSLWLLRTAVETATA